MNMLRWRSSSTSKKPSSKAIFKKFMEFLQTDVWRLPTINFLEKNSILFNREQANHELCVEAHQQYTHLVDTLIESYCLDASISTRNLVEALKITDQSTRLTEKEKHLLELVVAAQDFNVFVPLMTRINIELQLQAVKMLEPVSLKFDDEETELWQSLFDENETERYIIISVLKQSKEEFERDEQLRKALQEAFQSSLNEIQLLKDRRKKETELLEDAISGTTKLAIAADDNESSKHSDAPTTSTSDTSKTSEKRSKTPKKTSAADENVVLTKEHTSTKSDQAEATKRPSLTAVKPSSEYQKSVSDKSRVQEVLSFQAANVKNAVAASPPAFDFRCLLEKRTDIPEELLKQRAEYLRQQRDKLVEAKHRERKKQLIETAQRNATERPRTSQAAQGAMCGKFRSGTQQPTAELLEARRAIANRIRKQVIEVSEKSETNP